jgi:hypothetical protein
LSTDIGEQRESKIHAGRRDVNQMSSFFANIEINYLDAR